MPDLILAIDQGTTSSRAFLFDHAGQTKSFAQRELTQIYPKPGWVEHDPTEIWTSQREVISECLASSGATHSDLAAIGITNQRETTIIWDRSTGKPIHNAIVWQDRRTTAITDRLAREGLEDLFIRNTGLVLDPYFSASKISWLLDNVPGARTRAEAGELAFGTVDSWLVYKLTQGEVHVTDVSNASRTLLFNIKTLTWDHDLLEIFNVPKSLLPDVHSSSEIYGEITSLSKDSVPIAGIAGDQHAATFGQTCFAPGQGKNTYGTGCFLLLNTGPELITSPDRLLTTIAWDQNGLNYATEGSIFIGGAVVQWLRDGLGIIQNSNEVEDLASSVSDNGGIYFVPAFVGLGAPHWDPHARGTVTGITRGSTGAHLARAALEGIAFQVHDVVQAMEAASGIPLTELRVDGGACNNNLLMQFQADILGVPVVRPANTETTALGAAYLAGLAVGFWESKEEIADQWLEGARFEPIMKDNDREALLSGWQNALGRSMGTIL